MRKRWKFFTLLELLIVVSIIAILAGFLLPALQGARNKAKIVNCLNNLKGLGFLFAEYQNIYNSYYPSSNDSAGTSSRWDMALGGLMNISDAKLQKGNHIMNCRELPYRSGIINVPGWWGRSYGMNWYFTSDPDGLAKSNEIRRPSSLIVLVDYGKEAVYHKTDKMGPESRFYSDKDSAGPFLPDWLHGGRHQQVYADGHVNSLRWGTLGDSGSGACWEYWKISGAKYGTR